MTWMLVAFDDDTLAAVLDDARVRSLDDDSEFLLLTPTARRWGNQRSESEDYLDSLSDRVDSLRDEGVTIEHEWVPGEDLDAEIIESGRGHGVDGLVIAHHNPGEAIPDPEAFDDHIREELAVPLDLISLE
jgi:hypothetical protein